MKIAIVFGIAAAVFPLRPAKAQESPSSPSAAIVASVTDPKLASLLVDVLERNPEVAAAHARAAAARQRSPQARALPDPQVQLTAYLLPPETRVGPQRAVAAVSQRLPGAGKLELSGRSAEQQAAAAEAEVEAVRLRVAAEARRRYLEVAYLDAALAVLESDRATLSYFEELARARYASGVGLQQEVVAIQAEITRLETHRLDLRARRASAVAAINAFRGRPGAPLAAVELPTPADDSRLQWDELRDRAHGSRPELAAVRARIELATTEADLAGKRGSPDFTVGLSYGLVTPRSDADPPDNGQDILALTGGMTIPIWGESIDAGIEEATLNRLAAEEQLRATMSVIDRELEDLRGRIPEIRRRLQLFEGTLQTQSEQALRSAEAAYASGSIDGLALMDAERTLLEVRLAAARSRVDLAIALADLESAIAGPLDSHAGGFEPLAGESPMARHLGEPADRTGRSEPDARGGATS